jgi:hypothetical protein
VGTAGALLLGAEVIYIFFMIYFIVRMVLDVKAQGCKGYIKQPWNAVEVVILTASIVALAMYILKELLLVTILDDLNAHPRKHPYFRSDLPSLHIHMCLPDEYTNYMLLASYIEYWNVVLGFIVFMATIKFLRILRFNKHIGELADTMCFLRMEIFQFSIIFMTLMTAFACLANLSFGVDNYTLCTFTRSVESLFSMLIGRFKLGEFEIKNG